MSAFYFGPLGHMVPLVVSAGAPVQTGRGFSEFVSSGGVRHVQTGRYAPRTWTVSRAWQDPRWVRVLSLAAHGLLEECWLYDVAAARQNMIPAVNSAGSGPAVLVDGLAMGALESGASVQVPVLAGRQYTVAVWSAAGNGQPVFTYQPPDMATVTVRGTSGSGSRYVADGFTAHADGILTIEILRTDCSGIRVHEGPPDGAFHASYGTPCKVAVQDPQQVLQLVTQETRIDYSVTLYEVGRPGQI